MSTSPISSGASVGIDVAAVRAAVGVDDIFTGGLACVAELPEVNADGEWQAEVTLHQNEAPVTALMGGSWGSPTNGVWVGVEVGQECLLVFPDGDYEATPIIVAFLPTTGGEVGQLPSEMVDAGRMRSDRVLVVAATDVLILTDMPGFIEIRSRGGAAAAVSTLADLQANVTWLRSQFDALLGHNHPVLGGPPVTVVPNAGASANPPPAPLGTQIGRME